MKINVKRTILALVAAFPLLAVNAETLTWQRYNLSFEVPDGGYVTYKTTTAYELQWHDLTFSIRLFDKSGADDNFLKYNLRKSASGDNMYDTQLHKSKIDGFKGMITAATKQFPNAKVFATTLRQVINANEHMWGAIMLADGQWFVEEPRAIPVLDRIGGGDAFVGGMLYAYLKGWESEKWIRFGWATGAMATTMVEDYASPVDEDQVWSVWKGNARVKR